MGADLKLAIHRALERPASTLAIVFILSFGVAGTTSMFSVVNALFLKPIPFPDSERLVDVDETAPRWDLEFVSVSYPDFEAWRERNESFEALAAYDDANFNLVLADGPPRRVKGARVTHDLTRVLRIEPRLGRSFTPEEDRPGGAKVVLVGERLWKNELGGTPDVVGTTLLLDSEPHTIVGVLPPESIFIGNAELFVPLATDASENPGSWYLSAIGRLKDGTSVESARADLERIHKAMVDSRSVNEITSPVVTEVRERLLGEYRSGANTLFAAVSAVLLMVCANVAGLMLARTASRRREMGVRLALGAPRSRIVRQVLVEAFCFTALGGVIGVAAGYGALRYVVASLPDEVPRFVRFEMDGSFLAFALVLVAVSVILTGLAPALRLSKTDAQTALVETSRGASESGRVRFWQRALVVTELAVSLVLLCGAGVLLESFREILRVDPGFRPAGVLTYRLSLPESTYGEDERQLGFFDRHLEEVRALPGVVGAGAVSTAPFGNHEGWFFEAEHAPEREPDEKNPVILTRVATGGYFDALGITLHSGRSLDENDGRSASARVAVVNESFARRFWPGDDPIGKRIRNPGEDNPWWTVVGVARDVKHYGLATEMRPGVYLPFPSFPRGTMTIALKTATHPEALVPVVTDAVRRLDPTVPLYEVTTMSERLERSLWPRRVSTTLLLVFAAFTLVLTVAGIYGMVSYAVTERSREIAIRVALGARRSQVLGNVLGQGAAVLVTGVGLGVAGALALGRILSAFLFRVSPSDPWVYGIVIGLLAATAFAANWFPARRAASADPMESLRAS